MIEQQFDPKLVNKSYKLALGFISGKQGVLDDNSYGQFADWIRNKKKVELPDNILQEKFHQAKNDFWEGEYHFIICKGKSCGSDELADITERTIAPFQEKLGLRLSYSACQSNCENGASALLRIKDHCESFLQLKSENDFNPVLQRLTSLTK